MLNQTSGQIFVLRRVVETSVRQSVCTPAPASTFSGQLFLSLSTSHSSQFGRFSRRADKAPNIPAAMIIANGSAFIEWTSVKPADANSISAQRKKSCDTQSSLTTLVYVCYIGYPDPDHMSGHLRVDHYAAKSHCVRIWVARWLPCGSFNARGFSVTNPRNSTAQRRSTIPRPNQICLKHNPER